MKNWLFSLFFLLTCFSEKAVSQSHVDSLERLIRSDPRQDSHKALLLSELAHELKGLDPERSRNLARTALDLGRRLGFQQVRPQAWRTLGSYYYQKADYSAALNAFDSSENAAISSGDSTTLAWALNGKGTVNHSRSNYPEALKYYLRAVQLFDKLGQQKEAASIMGNAGVLYKEMGELDYALEYFKRGLNIQEARRDNNEISRFLNNIGGIYSEQKKYDLAERALNRSLELAKQTGNKHLEALALRNLLDVKQYQGEYKQAFSYAYRSLGLFRALGEAEGVADASYRLAFTYLEAGNPDSAVWFGESALAVAKKIGFKRNIFDTYQLLAQAYAAKRDFRKAYHAQQSYIAYKDSLTGEDKQNMIAALKFRYELDKKQSEIELLTKDKQLHVQQARHQRLKLYVSMAALVAAAAVAGLMIRNNRQKRRDNAMLFKQKEELQSALSELKATQTQLIQREKMASLGELTAGIAHEIQNPLNFVNNFSEINKELIAELQQELKAGKIQTALEFSSEIFENEKKIYHHGKRAGGIVRNMLLHSQKSSGMKQLVDLKALIEECLELAYHNALLNDKNFKAELQTDFDERLGGVEAIPEELGRVFLNLLNNAFFAVREKKTQLNGSYNPIIRLSTRALGEDAEITIYDNGCGIPEQAKAKIFQPFFTTKPPGEGTGLGLSLSYDIITKGHGGQLKFESEEGQFTQFFISLPCHSGPFSKPSLPGHPDRL